MAGFSMFINCKIFDFSELIQKRSIFSGKSNDPYYENAIKLLIENGVDKNVKNNQGKTACDIAVEKGQ